jgi:hypothetical protein
MENFNEFHLSKKEIIESNVEQLLEMIPILEDDSIDPGIIRKQNMINKIETMREYAKKRIIEIEEKIAKETEQMDFNTGTVINDPKFPLEIEEVRKLNKEKNQLTNFLNKKSSFQVIDKFEKEIKERKLRASKGITGIAGLVKDDIISEIKKMWSSPSIKRTIKFGGLTLLSASVLAVAAIALYRMFLTPAQLACRHKSGKEKVECIKEFKKQAIEQVIQRLQQEKSACNTSIRPDLCNRRIDEEIQKWERKLRRI